MSNLLKYKNVNVESERIIYIDVKSADKDIALLEMEKASKGKATQEKLIIDSAREDAFAKEIINNAKEAAKMIIDEANIYSADIIKNAENQAKIICEEAKTTGYITGLKAATIDVEKKNQTILEEIKQLFKNLDEQKYIYIDKNKKNTIDLAIKIAEKVINQRFTSGEGMFLKIYEKAVKDLTAQKWLKLSISKSEVQLVTSNSEYLLSMVSGAERLEIEVLDNAPEGTCIVETTEKIVDASISTQLNALHETMSNALN